MNMNARDFAITQHADQTYGRLPYVTHLDAVAELLSQFGLDTPVLMTAAFLHDIVEDTSTPLDEVRDLFGNDVAHLVFAVTNEPGRNRKERVKATYQKIRAAGSAAVTLKLCDRIANVEACWSTRDGKLFMYQREYRDFRAALRREEDGVKVLALWEHLDPLLGWYEPNPTVSEPTA